MSIALVAQYIAYLDKIFMASSTTTDLQANPGLLMEGMTADSVYIAEMVLEGLADYSRADGYVGGDVDLTWVPHQFTQDRGRKFQLDNMDNKESRDIVLANLLNEFIRTKVVPEIDAYRYATLAYNAGNSGTDATLTKDTVEAEIEKGVVALSNAGVPAEGRLLYATPDVLSLLRQSPKMTKTINLQANNGVIDQNIYVYDGMKIKEVPQGRFYDSITMYDGTTGGQEVGGFVKTPTTGKDLNFIITHPMASAGITKLAKPKIVDPDTNQNADAYLFGYRLYHDFFVYGQKVNAIYTHSKVAG